MVSRKTKKFVKYIYDHYEFSPWFSLSNLARHYCLRHCFDSELELVDEFGTVAAKIGITKKEFEKMLEEISGQPMRAVNF